MNGTAMGISIQLFPQELISTSICIDVGAGEVCFIPDEYEGIELEGAERIVPTKEAQILIWRAAIKVGVAMGARRTDFVCCEESESLLDEHPELM